VEVWVEIPDKATGVTLTIPMLDALKIAANINQQLVYALEELSSAPRGEPSRSSRGSSRSGDRTAKARQNRTKAVFQNPGGCRGWWQRCRRPGWRSPCS